MTIGFSLDIKVDSVTKNYGTCVRSVYGHFANRNMNITIFLNFMCLKIKLHLFSLSKKGDYMARYIFHVFAVCKGSSLNLLQVA